MSLLATCMSSLEQCTFRVSAQFLIRLLLIYSLLTALSLSCSIQDPLLRCRSFSLAWLQSVQPDCLWLVSARWRVRSYFPDQELNPCSLHLRWTLNHWTTKEVPGCLLFDVELHEFFLLFGY